MESLLKEIASLSRSDGSSGFDGVSEGRGSVDAMIVGLLELDASVGSDALSAFDTAVELKNGSELAAGFESDGSPTFEASFHFGASIEFDNSTAHEDSLGEDTLSSDGPPSRGSPSALHDSSAFGCPFELNALSGSIPSSSYHVVRYLIDISRFGSSSCSTRASTATTCSISSTPRCDSPLS